LRRRDLVAGAGALIWAGPAFASAPRLELQARFVQGGFALGRTAPRAQVRLDGEVVTEASAAGFFVLGFDRDASAQALLSVSGVQGEAQHHIAVAPTTYDVQRVNGLPPSTVNPSGPALLARIKAESRRKAAGFASRTDGDDFRQGFIMPLQAYRVSGRFGGQRILNGEPRPPHYGADLAAPAGSPVVAPAGGLVVLADPDMHFEGGLVLIDHGQGLVSAYLHLSKVHVAAGQTVARGQPIGEVGMTGRATGPHLCWRLSWRKRHLDPLLLVGARAPGAA